jgi:hypothetical protein
VEAAQSEAAQLAIRVANVAASMPDLAPVELRLGALEAAHANATAAAAEAQGRAEGRAQALRTELWAELRAARDESDAAVKDLQEQLASVTQAERQNAIAEAAELTALQAEVTRLSTALAGLQVDVAAVTAVATQTTATPLPSSAPTPVPGEEEAAARIAAAEAVAAAAAAEVKSLSSSLQQLQTSIEDVKSAVAAVSAASVPVVPTPVAPNFAPIDTEAVLASITESNAWTALAARIEELAAAATEIRDASASAASVAAEAKQVAESAATAASATTSVAPPAVPALSDEERAVLHAVAALDLQQLRTALDAVTASLQQAEAASNALRLGGGSAHAQAGLRFPRRTVHADGSVTDGLLGLRADEANAGFVTRGTLLSALAQMASDTVPSYDYALATAGASVVTEPAIELPAWAVMEGVQVAQDMQRYPALSTMDADAVGHAVSAFSSTGEPVRYVFTSPTLGEPTNAAPVTSCSQDPSSQSPSSVLDPHVLPGSCWPMAHTSGPVFREDGSLSSVEGPLGLAALTVRLSESVVVGAVTIDHPTVLVSTKTRNGPSTALREFVLYGFDGTTAEALLARVELGRFAFDVNGPQTQTFVLDQPQQARMPVSHVQLVVLSNHGNDEATCLYRLRVHAANMIV